MINSRPRLYLVTPSLGDTASFLRDLGPVLDAGDIAAVLLRLEPADERTLTNRAKSIATVVQRRDVALLLDGYPSLAARATQLVTDSSLHARMAEAARHTALTRFCTNKIIPQYEAYYKQVL